MLCLQGTEAVDHFLVECKALEGKRNLIMDSICSSLGVLIEIPADAEDLAQILLDCSKLKLLIIKVAKVYFPLRASSTYRTLQKTENHPKKT